MKVRTFAGLILLTMATSASAQLYKYVGHDGKVTYADRPPADATTNLQVFSAGVPRPLGAGDRGYVGPRDAEAPAAPVRPRRPAPVTVALATVAAGTPPDPRIQQLAPLLPALRTAIAETTMIDRTVDVCILTTPRAFRRYIAAQDQWKARNGAVTERVGVILAGLASGEERLQLEQEAIEHTAQRLQPVRASAAGKRAAWCDETADAIDSGKFDLAGSAAMKTLLQYQPR